MVPAKSCLIRSWKSVRGCIGLALCRTYAPLRFLENTVDPDLFLISPTKRPGTYFAIVILCYLFFFDFSCNFLYTFYVVFFVRLFWRVV